MPEIVPTPFCRKKATKDAAAKGYQKSGEAAKGAGQYAADTAGSVKESALDAAERVLNSVQEYLTWGESKSKDASNLVAKSTEVSYWSNN